MKLCYGCGRLLPLSAYQIRRASYDGVQHRCRECLNAARRLGRVYERAVKPPKPPKPSKHPPIAGEKFCSLCKQVKSRNDFHKKKSSPDSLQNWCKPCQIKKVLATIDVERARRASRAQRRKYVPTPRIPRPVLTPDEQRAKWRAYGAKARARKRAQSGTAEKLIEYWRQRNRQSKKEQADAHQEKSSSSPSSTFGGDGGRGSVVRDDQPQSLHHPAGGTERATDLSSGSEGDRQPGQAGGRPGANTGPAVPLWTSDRIDAHRRAGNERHRSLQRASRATVTLTVVMVGIGIAIGMVLELIMGRWY